MVTYQLILVCCDCYEDRLLEDKCLELLALQAVYHTVVLPLHDVHTRLVLVHRVQDNLLGSSQTDSQTAYSGNLYPYVYIYYIGDCCIGFP